jgi:phosphotransferase system enzyme I (PtsI)
MFRTQVRAILRASAYGNLRIVLPMVSGLDEFLEARDIVADLEKELGLGQKGDLSVPLGILIEVPSAVLVLESLAREADFFSLGTNDLIQYTLATGRLNEDVSYLYNPLHPAILALLKSVSGISGKFGKETIVCGEMASDPLYSKVLLGLGFDCLSVAPLTIPALKESLRNTSVAELKACMDEMLKLEKPGEIREFANRSLGGVSA